MWQTWCARQGRDGLERTRVEPADISGRSATPAGSCHCGRCGWGDLRRCRSSVGARGGSGVCVSDQGRRAEGAQGDQRDTGNDAIAATLPARAFGFDLFVHDVLVSLGRVSAVPAPFVKRLNTLRSFPSTVRRHVEHRDLETRTSSPGIERRFSCAAAHRDRWRFSPCCSGGPHSPR